MGLLKAHEVQLSHSCVFVVQLAKFYWIIGQDNEDSPGSRDPGRRTRRNATRHSAWGTDFWVGVLTAEPGH